MQSVLVVPVVVALFVSSFSCFINKRSTVYPVNMVISKRLVVVTIDDSLVGWVVDDGNDNGGNNGSTKLSK